MLDSALTPRRRPTAPQQLATLARLVNQFGGPGTADAAMQGVAGTFARMQALTARLEALTAGRSAPGELQPLETAAYHRSYRQPRMRADDGSDGGAGAGGEFLHSPPQAGEHLREYARRLIAEDGAQGGPRAAGEYFAAHKHDIEREEAELKRANLARLKRERGY